MALTDVLPFLSTCVSLQQNAMATAPMPCYGAHGILLNLRSGKIELPRAECCWEFMFNTYSAFLTGVLERKTKDYIAPKWIRTHATPLNEQMLYQLI
eukprot:922972-Amphidinium_carterae.1